MEAAAAKGEGTTEIGPPKPGTTPDGKPDLSKMTLAE
jgi:hypothetical protein